MKLKSAASSIGTFLLGVIILLIVLSLPAIFIVGGVAVGGKVLPWLMKLSVVTLVFCIVVFPPAMFFSVSRPLAGVGLFVSSYVFGATGWFMGLFLTWASWGGLAVLIGVLILGIGVVPIAMLATFMKGMWLEFGLLILVVILTFGFRIIGLAEPYCRATKPPFWIGIEILCIYRHIDKIFLSFPQIR